MYSETDQLTPLDATAALNGIIALLAAAGLGDNQIAAITDRDPREVLSLIDDAAELPAREHSVIDRARMTLAAQSQHGGRGRAEASADTSAPGLPRAV